MRFVAAKQMKKLSRKHGFSLVEVVIALGIIAIVIIPLVAFLPLGLKSNQAAGGDIWAANLLSVIEADIRGSRTSETSPFFGYPLPYVFDSNGKQIINSNIQINTLYTTGLNSSGGMTALNETTPYQVTVIYTKMNPVEARILVNWPAKPGATIAELTDRSKGGSFVEVYVSLSTP